MARTTPCVSDTHLVLSGPAEDRQTILVDSPNWYHWLNDDAHRSFAFANTLGKFTARKERKQQGGWYWVAYRQVQGTLYKTYLGKSEDLSLDRLLSAATMLDTRAQRPKARQRALRRARVGPLIATKFALPPIRPELLPRPRLFTHLQEGLKKQLTLLYAPPGFGKTTLLSAWLAVLAERGVRVAWVALDARDNDPVRFWSYLLTAINQAVPGSGEQALARLVAAQPTSMESVLTALINTLSAETGDVVLALDDYQMIETPVIHDAVALLLQHLPPRLHLILASRTDLPFALPRLRALGQSLELRTTDLQFTLEEAAAFLGQVMHLDLAPQDIALLHACTEGWVAGLQLAALSLQGRQDTHRFIASLSGSHRAIQEYLVAEVLNKQSEATQTFLLQTSVLVRLNGSLCDAVTDQCGSQTKLLALEQANLFLHPLDGEQQWYRFHPLFAEALRAQLQVRHPSLLPRLHERAAAWHATQGQAADAIEHLLAIPDYDGAARLIGQQARTMLTAGQLSTLLQWLEALPDETIHMHQELMLCQAWALLFTGQLHAALARLEKVITSYEPVLRSDQASVQNASFLEEAGAISRMLSAFHGSTSFQDQWAPEAGEHQDGDPLLQSLVALSLGFQAADSGDESRANQWLTEAIRLSTRQDDLLVAVLALCQLAEVHLVQGHLHQAAANYRQALRLATGPDRQPLPIAGIAYVGVGLLLREWNDLEAAAHHLRVGIELCTEWAEFWALDGYLALARVCAAQGDQDAALGAIQQAERIAPLLDSAAFLGHVEMTRVRLDLLRGQSEAATRWARTAGLHLDDGVCAEEEPMYLLFTRVLLGQGEPAKALQLVTRLLPGVEAAGRHGRLIELLALQALALHAQHGTGQALEALEHAMTLAAPERYARLFVELGAPMQALLRQARARNILPEYTNQLLKAFNTPAAHDGRVNGASPSDPLTAREREVLQLLALGASNRAIAAELVVTVGTVKKHLHTIFHKLQVESRTQAIATARTFSLI
jgi:LuxR family transcriptional regulator, maltose regulon positive regulatory protein